MVSLWFPLKQRLKTASPRIDDLAPKPLDLPRAQLWPLKRQLFCTGSHTFPSIPKLDSFMVSNELGLLLLAVYLWRESLRMDENLFVQALGRQCPHISRENTHRFPPRSRLAAERSWFLMLTQLTPEKKHLLEVFIVSGPMFSYNGLHRNNNYILPSHAPLETRVRRRLRHFGGSGCNNGQESGI